MAIPCQDCPEQLEDKLLWIIHRSELHEDSRRDSNRERQNS